MLKLFNDQIEEIKLVAIHTGTSLLEERLQLLTPNSQEKVNSFLQKNDRQLTFASELLKQYILPEMIGESINDMNMKIDDNGKIHLVGNLINYDYNISHSNEYVILALTKNYKIGIDIEYINENIDIDELGGIFFSETEQEFVKSIEDFYIIWTKKESFIKALGTGFMDDSIFKYTNFNLDKYQDGIMNSIVFNTRIFKKYMLSITLLPL